MPGPHLTCQARDGKKAHFVCPTSSQLVLSCGAGNDAQHLHNRFVTSLSLDDSEIRNVNDRQ
jgi:hypothetical protein